MSLLAVDNLRTYFHTREGVARAVDGVSFRVEAGENVGIVGESGSGKSVTAYSVMGLIPSPPGRIESGKAMFEGRDLLALPARELRQIRGRDIGMIFQDPMTALNPYMTIGQQLIEPLRTHAQVSKAEAIDRGKAMLREVGIQDPERRMGMYPHEFSGGMRQRVMIAMALITRPKLLIADEPTTALDVTVQAQILDLINRLREELGMAVIFITHDLGVVARVCDRVAVMYAGRMLESADVEALYADTRHPYTRALMDSIPSSRAHGEELFAIPGLPPDPARPILGCPFAPRCAHALDTCRAGEFPLLDVGAGHASACPVWAHGRKVVA
ncbi:MAG: ATP-binding cassette domain-containing protein [Candidatus Hydrogenedens sp.]|nr:ATP-binding cassette domain-containing protein [Candidatus Hydrogenedens sp.]